MVTCVCVCVLTGKSYRHGESSGDGECRCGFVSIRSVEQMPETQKLLFGCTSLQVHIITRCFVCVCVCTRLLFVKPSGVCLVDLARASFCRGGCLLFRAVSTRANLNFQLLSLGGFYRRGLVNEMQRQANQHVCCCWLALTRSNRMKIEGADRCRT